MSSYRSGDKPSLNEIRVIERDGRRVLQQWRQKPGGAMWELDWIDVAELPGAAPVVRPFKR